LLGKEWLMEDTTFYIALDLDTVRQYAMVGLGIDTESTVIGLQGN
jgi:hypothetical protein